MRTGILVSICRDVCGYRRAKPSAMQPAPPAARPRPSLIQGTAARFNDSWRRAAASERLRDYAAIVLIAVAARASCVAVGYLAMASAPIGTAPTVRNLLTLMEGWDAGFYWSIALGGYDAPLPPGNTPGLLHAFFPVYPLLIRLTMAVARVDHIAAGVAVSSVLSTGALFLVREYVRELRMPREVGIAAALLIAFAPHSFVFSAIYSESTFLFLLAAAMLALRKRRYLLAGLLAAVLSAARPNGVVFIVFALAWTLQTMGWRAFAVPWTDPRPFLTVALAPLGLVAYWWFCYATTGDAFAQATAYAHVWGWSPDWPWVNLRNHLGGTVVERFWVVGSLAYFAASLLLLRYRLFAEFAFCFACFVLYWTNVLPASLVRYSLVLFPIFIALARATVYRPAAVAALVGVFATLNGFLMVAFVMTWVIAI